MTEILFRQLLSFLKSRDSGQELLALICKRYLLHLLISRESTSLTRCRYKVAFDRDSPGYVFHQMGLNCIFNPYLDDPTLKKNGTPTTLMDVKDVTNYRLTFLRDEEGLVKWLQAEASLGSEQFSVLCLACSGCGSAFSGRFDDDPDTSWKKISIKNPRDHECNHHGNDYAESVDCCLCNCCFNMYVASGQLGQGILEKIIEMFPEGTVSFARKASPSVFPLKRKRTMTTRWDPTDSSSAWSRPLSSVPLTDSLRGRSDSRNSGS